MIIGGEVDWIRSVLIFWWFVGWGSFFLGGVRMEFLKY